jgi:ubiquinone/menaquinone biosynthesis C-methylase UbiE
MSHSRIANTFDDWAKTGRGEGMETGHGDVVHQVIPQLEISAGDQILDLGCGIGWATRTLAKAAAGAGAVGVDISKEMIAKAEELHSFTIRARYEVMPFEDLDLKDNHFSHVFSMEALYYAPNVDKALSEVLRVLKPGGRADIVIDFYSDNEATRSWSETIDAPMTWKSEADWVATFESAGFEGVTTTRVIDSRGPGDEANFTPSGIYPDWAARVRFHEAGSLWIHARKPS